MYFCWDLERQLYWFCLKFGQIGSAEKENFQAGRYTLWNSCITCSGQGLVGGCRAAGVLPLQFSRARGWCEVSFSMGQGWRERGVGSRRWGFLGKLSLGSELVVETCELGEEWRGRCLSTCKRTVSLEEKLFDASWCDLFFFFLFCSESQSTPGNWFFWPWSSC